MINLVDKWKTLMAAPSSLWVAFIVSGLLTGALAPKGIAAEVQDSTPQSIATSLSDPLTATEPADAPVANVGDLKQAAAEPPAGMDQVTSVSQLTDVKPTDWAFQALQSLVERYGCIVGYPDKTYRGNRALSRYEFAAGVNACLDRINELLAAATADLVKKEDLIALQKLQEEFAAELAALRGRVDALEVRTATLEKQQFSTTTKLSGLVWFNLTDAGATSDVRYEGLPGAPADVRFAGARNALTRNPLVQTTGKPNTTFGFLTWLTLNTSFTGKDSLVTQLTAGNSISPANQYASAGFFNAFGTPFTDQSAGTVNGRSDFVIHDLFYSFPVGNTVKVTVGPRVNWYRHFDFNRYTFFLTGASSFDSIGSTQTNAIDRGSGAVVEWNINKQFRFAAGYLGENTEFLPSQFGFNTSSNPTFGVFGGTNTSTAELTFSPTEKINLRVMYNYSRLQAYGGQVGGAIGEPIPYGYLDAGPGFSVFNPVTGAVSDGGLKYVFAHTVAFNFDWSITPKFGIFGRYSMGWATLKPSSQLVRSQSFQVGFGLSDLLKKGSQAVVTFLMPMDILNGSKYFVSGAGDGGTMYELEASYFYPVTDNIALVPAFYAIFNANNFDSNPTVFVGNLRAQFSF
ncbi:MAG: iron uptake porin [Kovacikia sp.]